MDQATRLPGSCILSTQTSSFHSLNQSEKKHDSRLKSEDVSISSVALAMSFKSQKRDEMLQLAVPPEATFPNWGDDDVDVLTTNVSRPLAQSKFEHDINENALSILPSERKRYVRKAEETRRHELQDIPRSVYHPNHPFVFALVSAALFSMVRSTSSIFRVMRAPSSFNESRAWLSLSRLASTVLSNSLPTFSSLRSALPGPRPVALLKSS